MLWSVENFVLDTDRRELRRDDLHFPVQTQVFDLVAFLIANRHRVVGRDDLPDTVWCGRIVSESTIATRVNAARRDLGLLALLRHEAHRRALAASQIASASVNSFFWRFTKGFTQAGGISRTSCPIFPISRRQK